jgi:tight adherence protein B
MDSLLLPIVIAATVALFVFGAVSLATHLLDPDRKRLQNRLSTETKFGASIEGAKSGVTGKAVEHDALTAFLLQWPLFRSINAKLIYASPEASLSKFLLIAAGAGVIGLLMGFALTGTMIVALACGACGAGIPFVVVNNKRNRRQKMMAVQLPGALDFLSRVLKAGHSLTTGLQMMGEELPKPLANEFRKTYDQHTLGASIENELKDMATRIDSTDFAFFVTAVLIQRQTGGDLSEVLKNISGMIRNRMRLQQHVKSKTAEGRLTGYVLVAFPFVMFMLLALKDAKYAHALTATATGHKLLALALALQMGGLWAIKKITTIKV